MREFLKGEDMNMKKKGLIYMIVATVLAAAFCVLTVLLVSVDVRPAGESGAPVGLATLNEAVFEAVGQNETALAVSEITGLCMIAAVGAFGVLGLVQIIRCKGILRADKELYFMACGLITLAAAYVLFEIFVINYRPVLDQGELAASYPSSHSMLAVAVAGMGMAYIVRRVKSNALAYTLYGLLNVAAVVTVCCRLLGGVHWLTDIVGGVLVGLVITFGYLSACAMLPARE